MINVYRSLWKEEVGLSTMINGATDTPVSRHSSTNDVCAGGNICCKIIFEQNSRSEDGDDRDFVNIVELE